MEATSKRNIRSGIEYDQFFPSAEGITKTIRRNADVSDTVAFIPQVVNQTLSHTKTIAERLKGSSLYDTCRNIWHFVYWHIQYKKDDAGLEQVRSPARAWHDRRTGVDCDCYTVFISSILTNLNIPHILRITKYHRDYFQHIYPIVPQGIKHITIDCVTNRFDHEVPFSEKKDYPMDLQYLNGFDGNTVPGSDDGLNELNMLLERNFAGQQTYGLEGEGLGLFGRKKKKAAAAAAAAAAADPNAPPPPPKKKKKGFFRKLNLRKVLNVVNKINPATVLLRNGLLLAMKLNIMNVAQRLRWGYLPTHLAASKNIDPARHQRLISTKEKLEKIFEGAGGKPSNLRKAILGGKGNKDKAVQGLDGLDGIDFGALDGMDLNTPLKEVLGEIYYSENVNGLDGTDLIEGLGDLGEPVSMATIGAAMGALKAIAAALKQIGSIFKGKGEGSADFDENINAAAEANLPTVNTTPVPSGVTSDASSNLPAVQNNSPETVPYQGETESNMALDTKAISLPNVPASNDESADPPPKETFWDKNKKWIKPVAIAGGGIAVLAIGYHMMKKSKEKNKSSPNALSGFPKKKKKNRHRKKKQPISLI